MVKGVYPRDSKLLCYKWIKLQVGIIRKLGAHMEAKLLEIELLCKFGVFWLNLEAFVEAFHMHLVTTTYGGAAARTGISDRWIVVLTVIRVIWE